MAGIFKSFVNAQGDTTRGLHNIHLRLPLGKISGLIGPSGAGKSTLLRIVNGLIQPDQGQVVFTPRTLAQKTAMIFQQFNLLKTLTVEENIALPLRLNQYPPTQKKERVKELAQLCHIDALLLKQPIDKISGGQKQRVAIARALATNPSILLADEATSALDPDSTQHILYLLEELNRTLGLTIIMVTHEMSVIKKVCDWVFVIDRGELIEQGPTLDVFAHPQQKTTQKMVAHTLHLSIPEPIRAHYPILYKISYIGALTTLPLLSRMTQQSGVQVNILQASIEPIKQYILGVMLVALEGTPEAIQQGLSFLEAQGCLIETLNQTPELLT